MENNAKKKEIESYLKYNPPAKFHQKIFYFE